MLIVQALVTVIALLHLWFLILEMFLWQKPIGLKTFRLNHEFARQSASLAANQGLYNGFLSAGLFWSIFSTDPIQSYHLQLFFLGCVAVAGIYAAISVSSRIFFIQALPALLTITLLLMNKLI